MKKKIPQTITVEIPVDALREEAVAYMKEVFDQEDIRPDVHPSDDELKNRFNRIIQDRDFIQHVQFQALCTINENIINIFEDHYDDEYIIDVINKSNELDNKEWKQRDA